MNTYYTRKPQSNPTLLGGKYDKSKDEFLDFRRSLSYQTLNNEYVKSTGEKIIANFLFELGLIYEYEKGYYWDGTPYRLILLCF